jgi:hypothetical protein
MGQDAALILAGTLGAVAVLVAIAALVTVRRTNSLLRAAAPAAIRDAGADGRREFANLLRRYSELLGVETVTGRAPNTDDSSIAVRVQLETELGRLREPGAVELVDEVADAREHLAPLEHRVRAAENGLIAMQVEWSIERWAANPRAWLADCREADRLRRIAGSGDLAAAS